MDTIKVDGIITRIGKRNSEDLIFPPMNRDEATRVRADEFDLLK